MKQCRRPAGQSALGLGAAKQSRSSATQYFKMPGRRAREWMKWNEMKEWKNEMKWNKMKGNERKGNERKRKPAASKQAWSNTNTEKSLVSADPLHAQL